MSHNHNVIDTDAHYKIDGITRTIVNIDETKRELVQNDHNSERFTFEIPRYVDGHDFSECNLVQIHYQNVSTHEALVSKDIYTVDDLQIKNDDENVVMLSWLISGTATKYIGTLEFTVRFSCVSDDGTVEYSWNTTTFKRITILPGIFNSDDIAELLPDVITDLTTRTGNLEKGTIKAINSPNIWELDAGMYRATGTIKYGTAENQYINPIGAVTLIVNTQELFGTKTNSFYLFHNGIIWGSSYTAFTDDGEIQSGIIFGQIERTTDCITITEETETEIPTSKAIVDYVGEMLGNIEVGSDYTLPVGGDELGGVKNGGNVVINEDGTMTAPESKVTDEQVSSAVAAYLTENPFDGSGWSVNAKNLLITILRNGVYITDQSENITALETELSVNDPDEPDVVTYTITNNLTNVTTNNSVTSVIEGASYSATITANEGYNLESVSCTMGGVAQTVNNGVINIASVTGDIVVVARATETQSGIPVEMSNYNYCAPTLYTGEDVTTDILLDGSPPTSCLVFVANEIFDTEKTVEIALTTTTTRILRMYASAVSSDTTINKNGITFNGFNTVWLEPNKGGAIGHNGYNDRYSTTTTPYKYTYTIPAGYRLVVSSSNAASTEVTVTEV